MRDKPYGGADKSSNGHRYDTVPFVNGMIGAGMSCQPIHYKHEEHDKFFEVCANFDALIIRCNLSSSQFGVRTDCRPNRLTLS